MSTTKLRSPIWQCFNISSDNNKYAICALCGVKISRGGEGKKAGTTAMSNHLKTKHLQKFKTIMEHKDKNYKVPSTSSMHETECKQSISQESVKSKLKWNENDAKAKKFHHLIAEMIAIDNKPLSEVENIGFTRLLEHALPRYEMPSCTYLTQYIVPDIYNRIYEKINRNIVNALVITVTSNISTCLHNNASFLIFTGHWVSPELQMQHGVLAVKPFVKLPTEVNIVKELNTTVACWNIEDRKIHMVIHNSDVNMTKDVKVADYDYDRCFVHFLHAIVTESLNMQFEVMEVIATCRHLVAHFNDSDLTKKLLTIQKELHLPEQQLVQDITTRWNSTFYMVERILKQKRAISFLMADNDKLTNVTPRQWSLMEQFIKLLKPFEEITKIITSGFSCISEVIPNVAILKKYLDNDETVQRTPDLVHIRASLKAELETRFTSIIQDPNYLIATFLDPRFKTKYLEVNEAERAQQKILLDHIKMSSYESSDSIISSVSTIAKINTSDSRSIDTVKVSASFWDCYDEVPIKNNRECQGDEKNPIISEINNYLNTIRIDRSSDPYIWWSSNLYEYPNLIKFARTYLSAPCSSVNKEKLYTEAGFVYEARLRRLSSNAEKLIFIHYNLPLVDFEY